MKIETTFNIGDKVWVAVEDKGTVYRRCGECDVVLATSYNYEPMQVTIERIMVWFGCEEPYPTEYWFKEEEGDYEGGTMPRTEDEDKVFTTKEEAQIYGDNQKIKELNGV